MTMHNPDRLRLFFSILSYFTVSVSVLRNLNSAAHKVVTFWNGCKFKQILKSCNITVMHLIINKMRVQFINIKHSIIGLDK